MDTMLGGWFYWVVGAVVFAIAIVGLGLLINLYKRKNIVKQLQLKRKSKLFSVAESNFYEALDKSLGDDFHIFSKVRVLDVVDAADQLSKSKRSDIENCLIRHRFDYVLCKKADLSIYAILELENFTRRQSSRTRKERGELISNVCKAAKLRLFFFDIRQDYTGKDLRRFITGEKRADQPVSATHQSQISVEERTVTEVAELRTCPKCHAEVVTKVAVRGKNIGEKFLMCRKFPYCDYQISVKDEGVQKIQREAESRPKKAGYSSWS